MVVDEFRSSLCRMATAGNERTSGIALFVDPRHLLLPSTPLFIKFLRFSPPLPAKTPPPCRSLLLTDVTQAFVTFWYTPRYKTSHLTRNNLPEFKMQPSTLSHLSFLQQGQTNYIFTATSEQRKIIDHLSCKSKNLIYLIQCNKCKFQYIGETKRQLNERFGEHCRSI